MEKKAAHYPLAELQDGIQRLGQLAFTRTALQAGADMGLEVGEMLAVMAGRVSRRGGSRRGTQAHLAGQLARGAVQGKMTMTHYQQCMECGNKGKKGMHRFEDETLMLDEQHRMSHMNGWRCATCGLEELDAASMQRYAPASDALVRQKRAQKLEAQQAELRRIRKKLKLTQAEAAALTGGGHNAFSRYERGEAQPMPAVLNLFRLLDHHPDLLKELQQVS